jgi:hypothetical protein
MKTTDFIKENKFIGDDAHAMHQDHEVQMARSDCYNAAKYAIELHKLLKNISEMEGLDGWVSEKITLANDYLRTVAEYLRHEAVMADQGLPEMFTAESAEVKFAELLGETTGDRISVEHRGEGYKVYFDQGKGMYTARGEGSMRRQIQPEWFHTLADAVDHAEMEIGGYDEHDGVTESDPLANRDAYAKQHQQGQVYKTHYPKGENPFHKAGMKDKRSTKMSAFDISNTGPKGVLPESDVAEAGRPDVMRHKGDKTVKIVKRGGVPIGEIGIDSEASPGNGQYYVKLYDGSYDAVGFDTAEEALAELKYAVKQGMAEGVTEAGAENNPVVNAITRRIIMQRTDLLSKYGLEKVSDAIDEVADFVGDVEEIGSSDVSGWVRHVEQMLGNMVDQSLAETTSAGGVATVPGVGGGPKVGSLFGGSYSPKTPFTGKKKAKESVIKR